jgi:hypothetical protein
MIRLANTTHFFCQLEWIKPLEKALHHRQGDCQKLIGRIIASLAGQHDTIYHRGSYLSGSSFFLHFIELFLTFHLQYFLQNLPMLTFVKAATPEICSMV